jgi:deoxycytidylate deaminase
MTIAPASSQISQKVSGDDIINIEQRQTDELVFAFVGPVGSGVTYSATLFRKILEKDYGYSTHTIKVSRVISECAKYVGMEPPSGDPTSEDRIKTLQKIGSQLRETFGGRYLAEKCVEQIALDRESGSGFAGDVPVVRRRAHFIDSFKNPAEALLLRSVYGDNFWLIGVFAPEDIRKKRLARDGHKDLAIEEIVRVDQEEGVTHGQRVRDTIQQSDFFIRNDGDNDVGLERAIERFIEIVFGCGVHTPTRGESAMYSAACAAATSACMSRQVGAAIVSRSGELIGIGANDVPKFGGGLYGEEDGDADNRCFRWGGKICHNDDRKSKLYQQVFSTLKSSGALAKGATFKAVEDVLKKTEIRGLIEYSRAVHAEMAAILSVARGAKSGLVGATMYCTTFPCHSCARHIVASGISRLIYIEPYPKSLASVLHDDAITTDEAKTASHVVFIQYEGVAPRNMLRLFRQAADRKLNGKLVPFDKAHAKPILPAPLDGFATREHIVVALIDKLEKSSRGSHGGKAEVPALLPMGLESGADDKSGKIE